MKLREFWHSSAGRILAVVAVIVVIAGISGLFLLERASSHWSREKLIELVSARFDSDIEVGDVAISLFPKPAAELHNIRFFHKGRRDVPPLIQAKQVKVSTAFWNIVRSPIHIGDVWLEGLLIQVPPKELRSKSDNGVDKNDTQSAGDNESSASRIIVDVIHADGAELRLIPKEAYKEPMIFEMRELRLTSAGKKQAMHFETKMTNAKPPGLIDSEGSFGPWNSDEPGDTPVSGVYRFKDADLGVFKGISGVLSSTGKYEGILSKLDVEGECDVPDFTVKVSGHPVHLKTTYKAVVDGTSGDTLLQPVNASFLKTRLTAEGGVVQKQGVKGKSVELDVDIQESRIEDLLRLAVKSQPMPLRGDAKIKTKFLLPPGDDDIQRRLRLDGAFEIRSAKFPDWNIQKKVEGLSNRASGEPEQEPTGDVVSHLAGDFKMGGGTITLRNLTFAVPGAKVALDGDYGLDDEALDFRGTLTMDAKISETTTGFKSLLAKMVDPFFSKDHAGSVIPIKITGPRSDPKFGLALGGGKKEK